MKIQGKFMRLILLFVIFFCQQKIAIASENDDLKIPSSDLFLFRNIRDEGKMIWNMLETDTFGYYNTWKNLADYEPLPIASEDLAYRPELSSNYEAGGLPKRYIESLLEPILHREDDLFDMEDEMGAEFYEGPPVIASSLKQDNLNMVVYRGYIGLNNSTINQDI